MDIINKASTLQRQCVEKVDQSLAVATQYFHKEFSCEQVSFDLKGRAAGQLVRSKSRCFGGRTERLRFNSYLLEAYGDEFIDQVVPHECAHLVAYRVYGSQIKPHGAQWRYVMSEVFGLEPSVTHSFEVQVARRLKRFDYRCECHGKLHQLSSIRHNKVIRGKANYICKECRQGITAV